MAGCPINQISAAASGDIPIDQWSNIQWPNEIWVELGVEPGQTTSIELDNVYTEFEDCEAIIFTDYIPEIENVQGITNQKQCPEQEAEDFILFGSSFWKYTGQFKEIIDLTYQMVNTNNNIGGEEDCVYQCRLTPFCITAYFYVSGQPDGTNTLMCSLFSKKVSDISNISNAYSQIWEKQDCNELSQNPPKGIVKFLVNSNTTTKNIELTFNVKYRDTQNGDIFDGPEKKILTNIGTKNNCGSETISFQMLTRDLVFHKQNQTPIDMFSTFQLTYSDPLCTITQIFIKMHNNNGFEPLYPPKWEEIPINTFVPLTGMNFARIQSKLVSKGGKIENIGFQTLAICGDETISSIPIDQNYKLTNSNQKLSWYDSERIVASQNGRLPTVAEVRHIIAAKAGSNFWSQNLFSQDPAKTDGQLVSSVQFIACGNSTNKQWISIGSEYTYNGVNFYPGMNANLGFGGKYPSWGDKYNLFETNDEQGMSLSQQQTKAQQLGGRLATTLEIEKFVTEKALKSVYDSGVYDSGYLTQGIRLTACTKDGVLKWCSIGMKSEKYSAIIYPGSKSDSYYCASGQINNQDVIDPPYTKSCDEISIMLWIHQDQDQQGAIQSWQTHYMNIIHDPAVSLQTQTSQVIYYRRNSIDFQEITALEIGFFFSIGTAANTAHIYCGEGTKMVYSLYINNDQNMNNLSSSQLALLEWNPTQPTYNSMISYDILTKSIKIMQTKGQTVSFIIRAETMGLQRAYRKISVKIVDCIDQQLQSLYPEDIILNYDANNGTHIIPRSEFEYNKLFSWSEPLCPVTTVIYQKTSQSTTDIFALEWVKMDNDLGLIINTNNFLQLNNTYKGVIVGQVEAIGGKEVRTFLQLIVSVPWVKPQVDFAALQQAKMAEQVEKQKAQDIKKAEEQAKIVYQKFLEEAQTVLQKAVKIGFMTENEALEMYNAVESNEISYEELQEIKIQFDDFQKQQRVENEMKIEKSNVKNSQKIINQTSQNQIEQLDDETPKPVETVQVVLTQSIQQQAEQDLAEYPLVKEEKPVDAPVVASKDHVDSLFNGWMTKTEDEDKKPKLQNGFVPPSPQMLHPQITRDGYLNFPFDQEMQVPDFIANIGQSTTGPNGRRLVALDEIDVSRDILDLQFCLKSDHSPSDIKYYMQITAWTPHQLSIFVNFTDPTIISKGQERDTIYIKLKNSNMFKSASTGKSLDVTNNILKQTIPRQLPKNVDRQEMENSAQNAKDAVAGIVYAQILFQIFAKKYKSQIASTFLCIQLCTFFTIFAVPIPSNTEIYLDQFRGLINFSMVNPDVIMGMFIKDFDFNKLMGIEQQKMSASEESSSMESTNFWANMSTFIFILVIMICLVVIAGILVVFCYKKLSNVIKTSLIQLKNDTFFGNSIKAQTVTYLKTTISFCVFFRTINFNASIFKVILSCSPLMLIIVYPIIVTLILICMKEKLGAPKIRDSIGQFYIGVDLKKGNWALFYYPITLFRRLLFVGVPYFVPMYPWNQVQLLIAINFTFSVYYIGVRPHMGGNIKLYVETHNECIIIMLCYHMFTFTDLVPQTEYRAIYSMGTSFTFLIAEVLISNLIAMFYEISLQQQSTRRKSKSQKDYDRRFRDFQEFQKLIYLEKITLEQNRIAVMNRLRACNVYQTKQLKITVSDKPFGRKIPFETIKECTFEDGSEDVEVQSLNIKKNDNQSISKIDKSITSIKGDKHVLPTLNVFTAPENDIEDPTLADLLFQYELRMAMEHLKKKDKSNPSGADSVDLYAATNFKYEPLENMTNNSNV